MSDTSTSPTSPTSPAQAKKPVFTVSTRPDSESAERGHSALSGAQLPSPSDSVSSQVPYGTETGYTIAGAGISSLFKRKGSSSQHGQQAGGSSAQAGAGSAPGSAAPNTAPGAEASTSAAAGGSGGGDRGGPGAPGGGGPGGNGSGSGDVGGRRRSSGFMLDARRSSAVPLVRAQPIAQQPGGDGGEFDPAGVDVSRPVFEIGALRVTPDAVATDGEIIRTKQGLHNLLREIVAASELPLNYTQAVFTYTYQALVVSLANNGSSQRAEYRTDVNIPFGDRVVYIPLKQLVECIACTPRRFLRREADLAFDLAEAGHRTYEWGNRNAITGVPGAGLFDAADYCTGNRMTPAQKHIIRLASDRILSTTDDTVVENAKQGGKPGVGLIAAQAQGGTSSSFVPSAGTRWNFS